MAPENLQSNETYDDELLDVARSALRGATISFRSSRNDAEEQIGGYRIIRQIGQGGMGTVFEAEQPDPKRRVALKIIKDAAYASQEDIRLFRKEIQVLGRLRHPGITQIYEAGHTADRRPYFAMEYIEGEPLTAYVNRLGLTLKERLHLIVQICEAVQYMHEHGVIHRDLKPANILVAPAAGSGSNLGSRRSDGSRLMEIKILDFGLARIAATEADLSTTATRVGSVMGTLAYMSPEQAAGKTNSLGVRSDTYTLGVLLYELLAGRLPYSLQGKNLLEGARAIAESVVQRPGAFNRACRGDLDVIVLKALSKESHERYESAAAIAADIDRYLHDLPIVARPPRIAYQLRKWMRQQRAEIAVSAVIGVAVIGAGIYLYVQSEERLDQRIEEVSKTVGRLYKAVVHHDRFPENAISKADEEFASLLRKHPRNWKILGNYVGFKIQLFNYQDIFEDQPDEGLLGEANMLCEQALDIEPDDPGLLNNHGVLLKKLKRYDAAREAYVAATRIQPGNIAAWNNLATVCALDGDLDAAEFALSSAASLENLENPELQCTTWRHLASIHVLRNDSPAETTLAMVFECDPKDAHANLLHARWLLNLGGDERLDDAMVNAQMAHQMLPGFVAELPRIRAWIALRRGRFEEAQALAQEAVDSGDLRTPNYLIQAMAAAGLEKFDEAARQIDLAEALWPRLLKAPGDFIASARRGVLWFESYDELARLRESTITALDSD